MNKTDRKNKTNLVVNWPTNGNYFTVKELLACNADFEEITLRTRINNAVNKSKTVSIIGTKNLHKGRPVAIYAMNPVSNELLDKAYKQDGILPPEKTLVNVLNVSSAPVTTPNTLSNAEATIPLTNKPTVLKPIEA